MPSSDLQHKTIKAAATATDQGQFTAIAAAYNVDRVGDRIIPGAFAKTIAAWTESGRNVPLHWDHKGEAENIIGFVSFMEERGDGLFVEGQLDIKSSATAREAWRSMKNNAVALSFGYLAKGREGKDGVTELTEIDLFEVSIVPAPANPQTRLLSLKAMTKGAGLDDVRAYVEDNFPGYTISAVEDEANEEPERVKSASQDPLVTEAWELIAPRSTGPRIEPTPEPEPEPLDAAALEREAWRLATRTSG